LLVPGKLTVGSGRTVEELVVGLFSVAPVVPAALEEPETPEVAGSGARHPVRIVAVSINTSAMMLIFFILFSPSMMVLHYYSRICAGYTGKSFYF
jgi:hypothetical protein